MPYLVNGQIGLVIVNVTTQEKSGILHIFKQEKGTHKFYDLSSSCINFYVSG